jgi:hypothetical protein
LSTVFGSCPTRRLRRRDAIGTLSLCLLLAGVVPARSQTPPAPTKSEDKDQKEKPAVSSTSPKPLGFSGGESPEPGAEGDFVPVPDRWRIGFPDWQRYSRGGALDPYGQNVLKGDYPIFGQKTFLSINAISDSIGEARRIPVASDVSSQRPGSEEFFGRGEQTSFIQEVIFSLSLFHGDAAFRPRDWEVRVTPVGNFNFLSARENGIVNIDVSRGDRRTDRHIGLQEAFAEVKLFDVSKNYDFTSLRAGIQGFTSDFRGFVFSDNQRGARLFGNFASNRYQWNLAIFDMLEKDTNSGLNTIHSRGQRVGVANFYAQDFLWQGYTTQLSFLYNDDKGLLHYDENDFLVRPAPIGDVRRHAQHVAYVGWNGEGHIGRLNITHAFYEAFGHDDHDPTAGRPISVNAQMAALELSADVDWWRPVASFLWSSGDVNPTDGRGRGFSAIVDNPNFAGGPFSFWNRQGIPLTQTGVKLVNPNSLLPDLRTNKEEGQANYVNPGVFLCGLFFDFKLTPKVALDLNVNYLRFDRTAPLELLLFQPGINREIGWDYGLGVRWRPFLNQQTVVLVGAAQFRPGRGFQQIFSSNCEGTGCGARAKTLYQAFASLVFAY